MAYKFRTPGPWGPGQSEDLDPVDVDNNFWQAIQDIAAKAIQGVGIANITVIGNQLTFVLTDHTIYGPFTLPIATIQFVGPWFPDHVYVANDIFTIGGSTYIVRINHTSAATFDPGATDGHGNNLYGLLLENPALTLPTGGASDYVLGKVDGTDYNWSWRPSGVPRGGTVGQAIVKDGTSDFAFGWHDLIPAVIPVQIITGASLTPDLTHANNYLRCISMSGCAITIDNQATVNWPDNCEIHLRDGTGQTTGGLTLVAGTGVTLNYSRLFTLQTAFAEATVFLKRVAADSWDVGGQLLALESP